MSVAAFPLRWWSLISFALAAAVAGILCASAAVAASPAVVDGKVALTPCFKKVEVGDRAGQLLGQPGGFTCVAKQRALGSGDFWVRMDVPAAATAATTTLRWNSVWQSGAVLHAAYPGGAVDRVTIPSAGSGRYVHIGANYTVELRPDVAPRTLLFRIAGSANMRGILIGPHLATAPYIAAIDAKRSALYGAFAGLCLALLTYNFMMWRALREQYLLAYCAAIAACMVYVFTSSGALALVVPGIDNNVRLRLNYAALALAAIAALWFARSFLDDRFFSPRYDRLVRFTAMLTVAVTLAFMLLSPWQVRLLDRIYFIAFGTLFLLGSGMFVHVWRTGGQIERLFVGVWTLPIIVNGARLLHGFNLIPHSFWLDNATMLAMTVEALLSSMLIGHRVRLMQLDRDIARADEAAARQLADTDELTGLSNRRVLMRAACPPPERAGLYRLVLVDVDNFKQVNDAVGHSAGDTVLQRIAHLIDKERRPQATSARLGGEEFAIIYPTTITDRRYHTGLLARVRALPAVRGQRVTVSMGAATGWLSGSESDWLALYRAADHALYKAKLEGRDRLVVAELYAEPRVAA